MLYFFTTNIHHNHHHGLQDQNILGSMNKFLLFCLIFISFSGEICCKIEGKEEPSLSKEEDLELERQLKVLNKPPLQSFQKEDGSIIDCIDIYKQPAFDHPLLKNHQLQMQPSLSLLEKLSLEKAYVVPHEQDDDQGIHDTKSQFPGCPSGTVPIRRTQKEDLIKSKEVLNHYAPMFSGPPTGTNYAGISTPQDTKDEYSAGKVGFTPYNLTMMIAGQISTASLRIGSGVDEPFNSVEYGYTFNEKLYGDRKARTFSLWTADGFQKTGCFNTLCQGFVQVSSLRYMGDELTDFAVSGGERKFMLFGIAKDPRTQNWWIIESLPSATNQWIGYWPKELFPNMNVYAKNVQVGGKVFNPSPEPSNTPMGSGYYAPGDFLKTCNADVKLIDSSWKYITAPRMQVLMDAPDLYKAEFLDNESLLFGGPDIGKR